MVLETGIIDLDTVENGIVCSGISYWRRLKGSRAYPRPQQIAPRELGGLLRNLVLVKVINGGEEYEFRMFGAAHVQGCGFNMQGSQLRDLRRVAPTFADALSRLYRHVLETRQPYAVRALRDRPADRIPIASENVLLPMGRSDAGVDHILVFSVYRELDVPQRIAC